MDHLRLNAAELSNHTVDFHVVHGAAPVASQSGGILSRVCEDEDRTKSLELPDFGFVEHVSQHHHDLRVSFKLLPLQSVDVILRLNQRQWGLRWVLVHLLLLEFLRSERTGNYALRGVLLSRLSRHTEQFEA